MENEALGILIIKARIHRRRNIRCQASKGIPANVKDRGHIGAILYFNEPPDRYYANRWFLFALFITKERRSESMERTTMSVQELSAQMGISLPKAYELVKTPGFPTLRIGTRILIPIDAYKEWLMKNAMQK